MNKKIVLSSVGFLFVQLVIFYNLKIMPNPIFISLTFIWYYGFTYIEKHSKHNYILVKSDRFKFDNT